MEKIYILKEKTSGKYFNGQYNNDFLAENLGESVIMFTGEEKTAKEWVDDVNSRSLLEDANRRDHDLEEENLEFVLLKLNYVLEEVG